MQPEAYQTGAGFTLQWSSVAGKHYTLQSAQNATGPWTTLATNLAGTGAPMQWSDNTSAHACFYRALVH